MVKKSYLYQLIFNNEYNSGNEVESIERCYVQWINYEETRINRFNCDDDKDKFAELREKFYDRLRRALDVIRNPPLDFTEFTTIEDIDELYENIRNVEEL